MEKEDKFDENKKFSFKNFINIPTAEVKITYYKLFWLMIGGSLLGVVLEGLYCLVLKGAWETHVVTIWGPFCLIYGIGAAGFYVAAAKLRKYNMIVKFLVCAAIGDIIELICGFLLERGMHMIAWDYSDQFLNFQGKISLIMTIVWGLIGTLYIYLAVPKLEKLFAKTERKSWKVVSIIFSVFMAVNFVVTFICMGRWVARHKNVSPSNKFTEYIDEQYNDDKMAIRFIEWQFIDSHK